MWSIEVRRTQCAHQGQPICIAQAIAQTVASLQFSRGELHSGIPHLAQDLHVANDLQGFGYNAVARV